MAHGKYRLSDVTVNQWEHGMTVGCKRDALRAFATHLADAQIEDMPQGMHRLSRAGRGFMRQTYFDDRQRFVYKLRATDFWDVATLASQNAANVSEYRTMDALARFKGTRTYASPVALYFVRGVAIIAMLARTSGDGSTIDACKRDAMFAAFREFRAHTGQHIGDMHNGNYRATPTKRPRATDVGVVFAGPHAPDLSTPDPAALRADHCRNVHPNDPVQRCALRVGHTGKHRNAFGDWRDPGTASDHGCNAREGSQRCQRIAGHVGHHAVDGGSVGLRTWQTPEPVRAWCAVPQPASMPGALGIVCEHTPGHSGMHGAPRIIPDVWNTQWQTDGIAAALRSQGLA